MKCKTTTVCKRISSVTGGGGGGGHFSKTFSIFYVLNSKYRVFNPYFLIGTCPMRKTLFANNLRVEPTIIFMEKISFSLKLYFGHFYGQSFIKTVRDPLLSSIHFLFCLLDINSGFVFIIIPFSRLQILSKFK